MFCPLRIATLSLVKVPVAQLDRVSASEASVVRHTPGDYLQKYLVLLGLVVFRKKWMGRWIVLCRPQSTGNVVRSLARFFQIVMATIARHFVSRTVDHP